ncbi:MAG: chemotaxis protein CheA [Betaproteobacteria bacterium RBG_16_58_11]|nr:MAG: chemotaxis protein CheA [Betaproteobacteria bacterium RBG_16_58_11]
MTVDMSQFYEVFFEEAAEHLASMESLLLKLDINAPDPDELNAVFRAAHSIKGGSGTFGFTDMTGVTHILENLLDKIRKGELALRQEMIDVFLEAGDVLKGQLDAHRSGGAGVDETTVAHVCAVLAQLASEDTAPVAAPPPSVTPRQGRTRFHLAFKRVAKAKLENLLRELAGNGDLKVQEESGNENLSIMLDTSLSETDLLEMIQYVVSLKQVVLATGEIDPTEFAREAFGFFEGNPGAPEEAPVAEEGDGFGLFISPAELKSQQEADDGFGLFDDAPGMEQIKQVAAAAPSKPLAAAPGKTPMPTATNAEGSSIRVSVEKVDQLINLVGELVITQAMLAQTTANVDPALYEVLLNSVSQLERNTRDLQESVMSIRMMPISFVFSRFPRVVRDVATKLGKQVELRTIGEGTELDKGLIEKIADPLTHLVRNSLDHGIETPEKRIAAGKDPKGTLTLRASHQGGNIVIEVSDDGGGLSRERILAKAKEKDIPVSDSITDQEVWLLIFAPGFSTAEVVTDVSGRGVGMDVVKRNIEGMGGRVELDSKTGVGTTVTIRLPLTLAILDGMSVAVGDEIFIIPLNYIIESLQPAERDVKTVASEGRVVNVRGEYLPLMALHSLFNIKPKTRDPSKGILVVIESDGAKAALLVDELVGQHQVVIKSLETNFRKVRGISAATIMGDGKVALILDMAALVRMARG